MMKSAYSPTLIQALEMMRPFRCTTHNRDVEYICLTEACAMSGNNSLCNICFEGHAKNHPIFAALDVFSKRLIEDVETFVKTRSTTFERSSTNILERIDIFYESLSENIHEILRKSKNQLIQLVAGPESQNESFSSINTHGLMRKVGDLIETAKETDLPRYLREYREMQAQFYTLQQILVESSPSPQYDIDFGHLLEETTRMIEEFGNTLNKTSEKFTIKINQNDQQKEDSLESRESPENPNNSESHSDLEIKKSNTELLKSNKENKISSPEKKKEYSYSQKDNIKTKRFR